MSLSSAQTLTAANGQADLTIPPHLARPLARLVVIGLSELERRNGGLPLTPGLASLLADLSGFGHAAAMLAAEAHGTWVVSGEAAALTGLTERSARRLAASGRVIARRAGGTWLIDRESIEDYARRTRAAGRSAANRPEGVG